jgi:hypothetical protein
MWGCNVCESTKSHAVKVVCLCEKYISLHTNHSSKLIFCPLTHCLQIDHMHVLGVVYIMKRSEWGLAAWCLGIAGGCVLWIRNKLRTPVEYALAYPLQRIYWLWQVLAVGRCSRCISSADSGSAE